MRRLILVKHSLPVLEPGVPAREWRLGKEGRRRCAVLADRLAPHAPARVVASPERKAAETAALVAACLGRPCETAAGLHEHERDNVPFYPTAAAWEAAVTRFFSRPDELVLGRETAARARERFVAAVQAVLAARPEGNVVIVAHGTVISLFVAHHAGVDSFPFWQRLGLPSFVVLSLPELALLETAENVEGGEAGA